MELLSKLGIDWKLLIAQIVNFAILLGVLTYFVYRPLLSVIDARRSRIEKAMEEAKRIEGQAKEFEQFRSEQLRKVDSEVAGYLERAKKQAEQTREEILAFAKREAEQLLTKGREQLTLERSRVMAETQEVLAQMIVKLTAKLIEREFTPADQQRLLMNLTKELSTKNS